MLPSSTEYLFALVVLAAVGISVLWAEVVVTLQKMSYWLGAAIFFIYCAVIETVAISSGWWTFNETKTLGISIWSIPVEEFALFALFYLLIVSAWEKVRNEPR